MSNTIETPQEDVCEDRALLEHAWNRILEQHFDLAKRNQLENGPGMSIFRFLRVTEADQTKNCEYYYAAKNQNIWNRLLTEYCPEGDFVQSTYHPDENVVICVQVPVGLSGHTTFGNIRLFSFDGEEVAPQVEDEDFEVNIPPTFEEGIHKRVASEVGV